MKRNTSLDFGTTVWDSGTHKIRVNDFSSCITVYIQRPYFFFLNRDLIHFLHNYTTNSIYYVELDCQLLEQMLLPQPDSRFLAACLQATKDDIYCDRLKRKLRRRLFQHYGVTI